MKTFILSLALATITSSMVHAQPIKRDVPLYPMNPPAPHLLDLNKQTIAILKVVHNSGADLYNGNDYAACYYMYLGSLTTIEPILKHHPKIQQTINQGQKNVENMAVDGVKVQAFKLHEVIEKVRNELQAEVKQMEKPAPGELNPAPEKKTKPTAPSKEEMKELKDAAEELKMKAEEAAKQAIQEAEAMKRKVEKAAKKAKEKMQQEKEPKAIEKNSGGTVMLEGKPVPKAEIAMTSLNLEEPRVFTATTDDAGKFTLPKDVVDGEYRVTISGDKVPSQYAMTNTSPLTVTIKDGAGNTEWKLEK